MLSQIFEGSLALRKLAAERSTSARVVGAGLHVAKKGVRFALKHPVVTGAGLFGLAMLPGLHKRWKMKQEETSPYAEQNVYPTNFWRRP